MDYTTDDMHTDTMGAVHSDMESRWFSEWRAMARQTIEDALCNEEFCPIIQVDASDCSASHADDTIECDQSDECDVQDVCRTDQGRMILNMQARATQRLRCSHPRCTKRIGIEDRCDNCHYRICAACIALHVCPQSAVKRLHNMDKLQRMMLSVLNHVKHPCIELHCRIHDLAMIVHVDFPGGVDVLGDLSIDIDLENMNDVLRFMNTHNVSAKVSCLPIAALFFHGTYCPMSVDCVVLPAGVQRVDIMASAVQSTLHRNRDGVEDDVAMNIRSRIFYTSFDVETINHCFESFRQLISTAKSCSMEGCLLTDHDGLRMRKCKGCKRVMYCSEACHVADWNANHRSVCKSMRS